MKGISFLCEDSRVAESRNIGSEIFGTTKILETPLSVSGTLPATHWYCFVKISDNIYQQVLEKQKNCIVEECNPVPFLNKHGLKVIKTKQ